jgi:hypothetical protein
MMAAAARAVMPRWPVFTARDAVALLVEAEARGVVGRPSKARALWSRARGARPVSP